MRSIDFVVGELMPHRSFVMVAGTGMATWRSPVSLARSPSLPHVPVMVYTPLFKLLHAPEVDSDSEMTSWQQI